MGIFLIIIAVIVVGIIIKFAADSTKQSSEVKSQGGMRKKYATLINHILSSDPKAKIFQEENTFISAGVSGIAGSTIFYIQQTYGNVTIQYEVKNNPIVGFLKKEWTFPENMDQDLMWERMNNDIGMVLQNIFK